MATIRHHRPWAALPPHAIAGRLAGLGWGAFLVWLGIAFLAGIGVGATLFGIGVITLAVQFVRHLVDLPAETFWIVAGGLFLLAGIWSLLDIGIELIPALLVIAGGAVLISALGRKRSIDE